MEAKFKRHGKWWLAKILAVYADNTYDVEYINDPGQPNKIERGVWGDNCREPNFRSHDGRTWKGPRDQLVIEADMVGLVIGGAGKQIKKFEEEYNVKINVSSSEYDLRAPGKGYSVISIVGPCAADGGDEDMPRRCKQKISDLLAQGEKEIRATNKKVGEARKGSGGKGGDKGRGRKDRDKYDRDNWWEGGYWAGGKWVYDDSYYSDKRDKRDRSRGREVGADPTGPKRRREDGNADVGGDPTGPKRRTTAANASKDKEGGVKAEPDAKRPKLVLKKAADVKKEGAGGDTDKKSPEKAKSPAKEAEPEYEPEGDKSPFISPKKSANANPEKIEEASTGVKEGEA